MPTKIVSISRAVKEAGGPAAVAAWYGITPPAVNQWGYRNRVPPARAKVFAKRTGIPLAALIPQILGSLSDVRASRGTRQHR